MGYLKSASVIEYQRVSFRFPPRFRPGGYITNISVESIDPYAN